MSEHRETAVDPTALGGPRAPRVIVGVDGTTANWSAVQWAVAEARRAGRSLLLVASAPSDTPAPAQGTDHLEAEHLDRLTRDLLHEVRAHIAGRADDISTRVTTGEPSQALVRAADRDDLLVVGKRVGHPWSPAVLGSTSVAVAARCAGAVVVVPEDWSVSEHVSDPIVAGVDGARDPQVLDVAFDRAGSLGVQLVVVHASEVPVPPTRGNRAADAGRLATNARTKLADLVAPWRQRYPDLSAGIESHPLAPSVALLGAATNAQLLVLGRHTTSRHVGGLGSTTRQSLHHARCPVVVVPHPA
jgi:nucleotide-binding universal stress UspA family protein